MFHWHTMLIILVYVYLAVTILYLLLDNRDTSTTLAWLLVFILFPFIGLGIYFIFGRGMRKQTKAMLAKQNLENRLLSTAEKLIKKQEHAMLSLCEKCVSPAKQKLMKLLYKNSDSILTKQNDIDIFVNGEQKFDRLLADLEDADTYIHMEYFIWKDDPLAERVIRVLEDKVAQGISVRILYDVVGNYLSRSYLQRLRSLGIHIYPYYNFLSPLKIHTLNYRNHRKIVIIDGKVGYVGGMNMAEEYITGGTRFPSWRDTHMRIEGEAVAVLQGVFSVSWFNTTQEKIDEDNVPILHHQFFGEIPIQITTSGPDSEWESIKQLYFLLISCAEKTIYIHTPYFVPDATIVMALETAALSGIDVRIMLTGFRDKQLPYWAAMTYLKDLLKAGVKFYYYTKGFMHAKTVVVDAEICSIGTANLDIRSLQLNYEINALIYDEKTAQDVYKQFLTDIKDAQEYTLQDYYKVSKVKQLRNSLVRLFSPLL